MLLTDQNGNICEDVSEVICPIGEHLGADKWQLSGSGFLIGHQGIALTAAHCFYKRGSKVNNNNIMTDKRDRRYHNNLSAFHRIIPDGPSTVRIELNKIYQVIIHRGIDIAIALVELPKNEKCLNLTRRLPEIGEPISVYGYPNATGKINNIDSQIHLNISCFHGTVTSHLLNGRDSVLLPGPCIAAELLAPGGMSGGPAFDKDGNVFGVVSTCSESLNISYITPILSIINTKIDIDTNIGKKKLSINELANMGVLKVYN